MAGQILGRFLGLLPCVFRAPGAFGGVSDVAEAMADEGKFAKRPVLTSVLPRFAPYMPRTAPFLPRRTLVLPPMLWSSANNCHTKTDFA